ncbi:unnamed protein product [Absidia cylindrospora]
MLSVYSGMDMNFTQAFPTTFGLARSRVSSLQPQQAFRQQQQQVPLSYSECLPTSSMVEPMMPSDMNLTSTPPSTTTMYYPAYSSTFVPSSSMDPVPVNSSPSIDTWNYTASNDIASDSTVNQSLTSHPQHLSQQLYMYSSPNDSSYPSPHQQQQNRQQHESHLYPASSSTPTSSSSIQTYSSVPSFQSPYGYQYHDRKVGSNSSSSPQMPVVSSNISSPASSIDHQQSGKIKSAQTSPMVYSKTGRSPSSSPPFGSIRHHPYQQHHHHHHVGNSCSTRPLSMGSLSPLSEQGSVSGSMPYPSMNMITSFPTKINASTGVSPKRYECHICSKKFTRPSSLTTHVYSHTGEKPFQCPVEGCGRHFSVVSNLRRHAKIHTNSMGSKC